VGGLVRMAQGDFGMIHAIEFTAVRKKTFYFKKKNA
jgi:hypothetical protein